MTPAIPAGDARALTRALVQVDSRNPTLAPGAPGELACATLLRDVLDAWGFRTELQDAAPGRPNLVARIGDAAAGSRSLMLNGHLDVVGVEGMLHAPFAAEERDGRIYGRGSADMKGGVAAMCAAAHRAAGTGLRGEIIIAAVADEEYESLGTRALLAGGIRADACVITEPTRCSRVRNGHAVGISGAGPFTAERGSPPGFGAGFCEGEAPAHAPASASSTSVSRTAERECVEVSMVSLAKVRVTAVVHACRKRRAARAQRSAADRPQVTQYFQPRSSSLPHAGQWTIVRSWPQCGQNWICRPAGSSPLQKLH
jgi:hypothetical protein